MKGRTSLSDQDKLVVQNLFKVFGDEPQQAIDLYNQGLGKDEVFESTGQTIGVCDANFAVQKGEIFVVMGLSGSGKSTLVRLLNRLIEPTAGKILVDGLDIATMSDRELLELRRRQISMVFQSFALMPHLTVVQNAAFGLELAGIEPAERETRAREALEQVGLFGLGGQLSRRIVGRHAATCRPGARAGERPIDPADGRGVLGLGSADPL